MFKNSVENEIKYVFSISQILLIQMEKWLKMKILKIE